ncbi:MAG: hypothetical protein GF350_14370 [Chitinivibrionales bacterium]|nr:hypothetical protein [Chitinivibrionales bacterium]
MKPKKSANSRKELLIKAARKRHGTILPVADVKDLDDSFTTHHDALLFWYNTEDGSTHIVKDANKRGTKKKK